MENQEQGALSGADKAAMLLLVLGEQDASSVLKHLSPDEVQQVGGAMSKVSHVSKSEAWAILEHYEDACLDSTSIGMNTDKYITNIFTSALGHEKAPQLIDRVLDQAESSQIEQLSWLDAKTIIDLVKDENPQIIAITLASLEGEKAAEVLSSLPIDLQKDVVKRVATLSEIPQQALNELEEILKSGMTEKPANKVSTLDGPKKLAEMINCIDPGEDQGLLEEISNIDNELAERIKELMFVFDNLISLSDKDIQRCMRDISSEILTLSLKGASQEVTDKIFKNMSSRAGQMIKEDLENRGPVKISDVEQSQKDFLAVVRKLSEAGEISLGQNSRDYI
ncbi:MAG: flagellar motor switch protein FliG [Sinobacterium sp.]|nr:flagellar motor switch protein FliG [Sinobacterium sp.]